MVKGLDNGLPVREFSVCPGLGIVCFTQDMGGSNRGTQRQQREQIVAGVIARQHGRVIGDGGTDQAVLVVCFVVSYNEVGALLDCRIDLAAVRPVTCHDQVIGQGEKPLSVRGDNAVVAPIMHVNKHARGVLLAHQPIDIRLAEVI